MPFRDSFRVLSNNSSTSVLKARWTDKEKMRGEKGTSGEKKKGEKKRERVTAGEGLGFFNMRIKRFPPTQGRRKGKIPKRRKEEKAALLAIFAS